MFKSWQRYLRISRPRFWLYLAGPYVIGLAAASASLAAVPGGQGGPDGMGGVALGWLVALGLFFTYPANFIIYGINDVYDYDTDKLNPKKRGYEELVGPEQRWLVLRHALTWIVAGYLLLEFVPGWNDAAAWGLLGFYCFGVLYSMPPVRAKTKPFVDSAFNVLYVFPGVVSYALVTQHFPAWQLLLAAGLWCAAMHAYSAIPDIAADSRAGLRTVATLLGARRTLVFCGLCYLGAVVLSWLWLGWFSVLAGTVYLSLMALSWLEPGREQVFRCYRYFPYINMVVGAGLFFWITLSLPRL